MDDEHDPWNQPELRHPRARELMPEVLFDCVNELAPFGSDEGADAYADYREWRADHPGEDLSNCIAWIGSEDDYPDRFTYDATIIATVLGQLIDEGRIDEAAKPHGRAAIARQLEESEEPERVELLELAAKAIESG